MMSPEKNINILLLVFFVILLAFVLISDRLVDYHRDSQAQDQGIPAIEELQ
jgi:hypothetical protein